MCVCFHTEQGFALSSGTNTAENEKHTFPFFMVVPSCSCVADVKEAFLPSAAKLLLNPPNLRAPQRLCSVFWCRLFVEELVALILCADYTGAL